MVDDTYSSDSFEPDHQLEQQWVEAVRNSDKKAFKKIFETYYDALTRFAFRYLKSSTEAESAVQDVFLWIWEKRKKWQVEGTLKTYLFRSVKYKALDRLRHEEVKKRYVREHGRWQTKSKNPEIIITEKENEEEKFARAAQDAIEELPDRARIIYKMSRLEGLTYNEIADVLEISPKTVESQMSRALDILRSKLSKYLSVILMLKMADTLF